jgi:hypothetical protein
MTATRAAQLAIAIAVALAVPATAHAQLVVQSPQQNLPPGQIGHGMLIITNNHPGAVTITDIVQVPGPMCPDPARFGTPAPLPHTFAGGGGTFTFDMPVGPFEASGLQSCRYTTVDDSGTPPPQFSISVNVGPNMDIDSGLHIEPNGLAFGAVAPGGVAELTLDSVDALGGSTATPQFTITGPAVFEMVQPCSSPPQGCSGGTIGPGTPLVGVRLRCAPAPAATPGWREGSLTVRGWMTMLDTIVVSCDVRGTAGPPPDAAPGPDADPLAPDADPLAPDADPFAPDARPGGNPGTGDGFTTYYACGCDGSTGAGGGLIVLLVIASGRRMR